MQTLNYLIVVTVRSAQIFIKQYLALNNSAYLHVVPQFTINKEIFYYYQRFLAEFYVLRHFALGMQLAICILYIIPYLHYMQIAAIVNNYLMYYRQVKCFSTLIFVHFDKFAHDKRSTWLFDR